MLLLQVTTRAVTFLKEARSQQGLSEDFGVRAEPLRSDAKGGIRLEFMAEPVEGDQVSETRTEGLRVFVSPDVAAPLAAQAIDTRDAASGSDLVLRDQSENGLT